MDTEKRCSRIREYIQLFDQGGRISSVRYEEKSNPVDVIIGDESEDDNDDDDNFDQCDNSNKQLFSLEIVTETEEFIKDEENYCKILEDVVENYIKTINTTKFDILETFGRVDLLYSYQKNSFLTDVKNATNALEIAKSFIKHQKLFNSYYKHYFKNLPNLNFIMSGNKDIFMGMESERSYKQRETVLLNVLSERIETYQLFLESMKYYLSPSTNLTYFDRAIAIIQKLTHILKKDGNISYLISELVETERIYLDKLKKITKIIIPKVKHSIKQTTKQKALVGYTTEIYEMQIPFFEDLKKCLFEFSPNEVAESFIQHRDTFLLYVQDHKLKNGDALEDCTEFLREEELAVFDLYAPLNRLYKYKILLQALQKTCTKKQIEHTRIQDALELIMDVTAKINNIAAINCIRDENINLDDQGDLLLRDTFVIQNNSLKYEGMVFLFEKAIIFTKTFTEGKKRSRRDVYLYQNHIITKYLYMALNVKDKIETNFELAYFGKSTKNIFNMQAGNQNIKDIWVGEISKMLMTQLLDEKQ